MPCLACLSSYVHVPMCLPCQSWRDRYTASFLDAGHIHTDNLSSHLATPSFPLPTYRIPTLPRRPPHPPHRSSPSPPLPTAPHHRSWVACTGIRLGSWTPFAQGRGTLTWKMWCSWWMADIQVSSACASDYMHESRPCPGALKGMNKCMSPASYAIRPSPATVWLPKQARSLTNGPFYRLQTCSA